MIDVLIYLLESYLQGNLDRNQAKLTSKLKQAGYEPEVISHAFDWLESIKQTDADKNQELLTIGTVVMRSYTQDEMVKLSTEARGFLLSMEQIGVLTPTVRELAIDRAMDLEDDFITQAKMQWVVMVILFSRSDRQAAWTWIENIILQSADDVRH